MKCLMETGCVALINEVDGSCQCAGHQRGTQSISASVTPSQLLERALELKVTHVIVAITVSGLKTN